MIIETKAFGEVEITEDKIITFPGGIIGFPDLKRFTLLHDEEKGVRGDSLASVPGGAGFCHDGDGSPGGERGLQS